MTPKKALSVRSKILLALAVSMVALCAALLAASALIIQTGFARIEEDAVSKDLSRLSDQLASTVDQQLVKLKDWSTWDDSYKFAGGTNPAFIEDNLPDTTLANLDLELVAYFDPSGKLIYAKEIDRATGESVPATDAVAAITADPLLAKRESFTSRVGGFIALPKGPLMLGSLPLLRTDSTGPSTGSMIFARYLDPSRVTDLSGLLHLSVDAFPYDSNELPADAAAAKKRLDAGDEQYVVPLSESVIAGYAPLKDVHGKPILLMRIEEPRPIYVQGNISIATFLTIGGAALIVFGLLMVFLLERLVIARFVRLTETVEKVNDTKDLSVKVSEGEMDEIGRLAQKINQLLAWLSEAREGEAASRREALNLLTDLKQEKAQSEEMKEILKIKKDDGI